MCDSLTRAFGFLLCACVRYSCKLSFYCDLPLILIRLDIPEYTEPRSTPSMAMSVSKLIEEGGEPGRLLTGHLFAVMYMMILKKQGVGSRKIGISLIRVVGGLYLHIYMIL